MRPTPEQDDALNPPPHSASDGFSIGTVAGMTGLDPHTIRAWERRYAAVTPQRTARGVRRYGQAEVTRLQLLKALVDCGEPIGSLGALPDDMLRERLATVTGMATPETRREPGGALPIALLAPGMAAQIHADASALGRFEIAQESLELPGLLRALPSTSPRVVVAELRALGSEPLRALQSIGKASGGSLIVVLYEFATAAALARLSRGGARLVRGPLRVAQLRRSLEDFLAIDFAASSSAPELRPATADEPTPRRFDDASLSRLLEITGAVDCECPSHLASLVANTLAFELYSKDCESRSPEDARLHRHLALTSARLRGELEDLLAEVCRHEGLAV